MRTILRGTPRLRLLLGRLHPRRRLDRRPGGRPRPPRHLGSGRRRRARLVAAARRRRHDDDGQPEAQPTARRPSLTGVLRPRARHPIAHSVRSMRARRSLRSTASASDGTLVGTEEADGGRPGTERAASVAHVGRRRRRARGRRDVRGRAPRRGGPGPAGEPALLARRHVHRPDAGVAQGVRDLAVRHQRQDSAAGRHGAGDRRRVRPDRRAGPAPARLGPGSGGRARRGRRRRRGVPTADRPARPAPEPRRRRGGRAGPALDGARAGPRPRRRAHRPRRTARAHATPGAARSWARRWPPARSPCSAPRPERSSPARAAPRPPSGTSCCPPPRAPRLRCPPTRSHRWPAWSTS